MSSSWVAPKMIVQPGSNGILPQDPQHRPSHMYISTSMPPPPPPPPKNLSPPYSKNMPPPPPRNMPPPPPKFPSIEVLRNENRYSSDLKEPMVPLKSLGASSVSPPKVLSAQLPSSNETKEEKPSSASVSDTLLKLMDYGDDDDDDDDDIIETDNSVPGGTPTPSSGQKPFWSV